MSSGHDLRPAALIVGMIAALASCKGRPTRSDEIIGSAAMPAGSSALPGASAAPEPSSAVTRGSSVVVLDEPKIELPKQESFRLLDAGQGTRTVLRYHLAPGTARFLAQTALSSRHLDRGAFSDQIALPGIRDGFAVTVTGDRPDRIALLPLPGESAAASPEADTYLGPWRTLLQNRRITAALDDRGAFSAIAFNDDPTGTRSERARHELVQRLLALIVPLPAEAVGNGASWRVVTILRQGPVYAKQTATYTLIARGPERWKLHARLLRVAEEQRIDDPALPPGTTADLLALFRNVEGDVEVDPTRPLITGGSLAIESRLHVKLTPPGQPAAQAIEQIFEDTGTASLAFQPQ